VFWGGKRGWHIHEIKDVEMGRITNQERRSIQEYGLQKEGRNMLYREVMKLLPDFYPGMVILVKVQEFLNEGWTLSELVNLQVQQ